MFFSKSIKHCRRCISARNFNPDSFGTADATKMTTKLMSLTQWKILNQLKEYYNKYSSDKNIQSLNKELASFLQKIEPSVYGCNVIKNFESVTKDEDKQTIKLEAKGKESEKIEIKSGTSKEGYGLPKVLNGLKLKISKNESQVIVPVKLKWKTIPTVCKCNVTTIISMISTAESDLSKVKRIEDLISHVQQYPEDKHHAFKEGVIKLLLRIRGTTDNPETKSVINEAFAALGYVDPLPSRGIRILSIDGGGTRGILVIHILQKLEELTGRKVYEMFDMICGVSTGAIIACGLGANQKDIPELMRYYKVLSTKIFSQNAFWGTSNLVWSHSYYDTKVWEEILKEFYGEIDMLKTSRKNKCPKVMAISAVVNQSATNIYVFRNYSLPYKVQSQYMGSSNHKVWEAVRASAAAPTYFEEFKLGDLLHQDGGIMVNNPTAVAVHEARKLWPNKPIQCVVSIGTGRTNHSPEPIDTGNSSSWKTKFLKILDSATDTESVHMTLNDLLPPNTYYRFNPYLTEMLNMAESRTEKIDLIVRDVMMYLRRNEDKFQAAAKALEEQKSYSQQAIDWFNVKREMLGANIVK